MKFFHLLLAFSIVSATVTAQYSLESNFGYDENVPYAYLDSDGIDYWYDSTTGSDGHVYFTGWTQSFLVLGSMNANGEFNLNYAPDYNKYHAAQGYSSLNGYEIEMQSSNQPVVGGISIMEGASVSSIFMARFTQGGNLDPTFGELGYFHYAPVDQDCFLGEIIVSPEDEVFMLGRVRNSGFGDYSHLIIKLTADGQLDESFSEDGILRFNASGSNSYLSGGVLMDNGQLLVAGRYNGAVKVFRINPDGTVDAQFNNGGVITTSGLSEILAIKQYGDWFYAFSNGSGASSFLYKFNENGLDETYGNLGEIDLEYDAFNKDAWFTDDGKVIFTGSYLGISHVARADTSGVLDSTFFEGGSDSFEISENNVALFSSTQLNDGSIITSGHGIDLYDSGSGQDFVAYKITENGVIDNVQEENVSSTTVYPNPFTSEFMIESELPIKSIRIFDLSGMLVYENYPLAEKHNMEHLEVPSGIYSVHVQTAAGVEQVKVVKL